MGPVLVTGGSRGIGRAVVEALASAGHPVGFTWCSDAARAREVEEACAGKAVGFPLDLRDRDRPAALVAEVEARLGPLQGLVNNAGVRRDGLVLMMSDADWDEVLDIDLGGVFRCCRAVLPGMVQRRSGHIVNIASLTAQHGLAGQAAYAAAKAGVVALTRCLAREVGSRGIRANAVLPGFVATDLTADVPEEIVKRLRSGECLRSGLSAAAVAAPVVFLLSPAAAAITGQVVVVDAGATA